MIDPVAISFVIARIVLPAIFKSLQEQGFTQNQIDAIYEESKREMLERDPINLHN